MALYIKSAFAEKGDKEEIPFTPDGKTSLDFQRGYTATYELDPDAGGEWIKRTHFNYMLNVLSNAIQELQRNGTRDFDNHIIESGGYNLGESCLINYNPYTRELVKDLPKGNGESAYIQKIKVVSLINENKNNPYNENALFDTWLVDDGFSMGNIILDSINHAKAPAGFLKVNTDKPDTQYSFNNFKRVREFLKDTAVGKVKGLFKKYSLDTFQFVDIRGHFMRTFSNGSTIDKGRDFNTLQTPALPNIKGTFYIDFQTPGFLNAGAFYQTIQVKNVDASLNPNAENWRVKTIPKTTENNKEKWVTLFDASIYNSIYKNSENPSNRFNEVVPQNYAINVFVKI